VGVPLVCRPWPLLTAIRFKTICIYRWLGLDGTKPSAGRVQSKQLFERNIQGVADFKTTAFQCKLPTYYFFYNLHWQTSLAKRSLRILHQNDINNVIACKFKKKYFRYYCLILLF
jgi:hypothetical protein